MGGVLGGCILVVLVVVVLLLARRRMGVRDNGHYKNDTANRDQVAFSNPLCKNLLFLLTLGAPIALYDSATW